MSLSVRKEPRRMRSPESKEETDYAEGTRTVLLENTTFPDEKLNKGAKRTMRVGSAGVFPWRNLQSFASSVPRNRERATCEPPVSRIGNPLGNAALDRLDEGAAFFTRVPVS